MKYTLRDWAATKLDVPDAADVPTVKLELPEREPTPLTLRLEKAADAHAKNWTTLDPRRPLDENLDTLKVYSNNIKHSETL